MRRWLMAAAVVAVGGVGAFLLTDNGKDSVRRWPAAFESDGGTWNEWNEAAQLELERIQAALNEIAERWNPAANTETGSKLVRLRTAEAEWPQWAARHFPVVWLMVPAIRISRWVTPPES